MLNKEYIRLSHHGSIPGMLSFNFVQKVMLYHSNLERTALASCFTELMLIVHKSFNNVFPINNIFELLKVYIPSRTNFKTDLG